MYQIEGYTFWFYHGESDIRETSNVSNSRTLNVDQDGMVDEDPIRNMIGDALGVDRHLTNEVPLASNEDIGRAERVMPNVTQERREAAEFEELARDGEQPLYVGCRKYSKLSFLVKLYHIKCLCGMSDKAMTMILELLHDAFENAKIPSSFYEAKKTISKLGLNYEKIHACLNNCMLYWDKDEEKEICKVCNKSRWKSRTKSGETQVSSDGNIKNKVPAKVLHYLPLKPYLQR